MQEAPVSRPKISINHPQVSIGSNMGAYADNQQPNTPTYDELTTRKKAKSLTIGEKDAVTIANRIVQEERQTSPEPWIKVENCEDIDASVEVNV